MQPTSKKSLSVAQVYVIQNELGLVKIGFANKPDKRIDSIAANSGLKIVNRHVSPPCFNFTDVEKQLHQHFSHARKHGEWFDLPFEIAVDALNAHFTTPAPSDNQALTPFQFENHAVRTVVENDQIWFVAKDVCDILELSNVSKACANLDDDEKQIFPYKNNCISESYRIMDSVEIQNNKNTIGFTDTINNRAGNPNLLCINESGLYALVLRSNKPQAKAFRKWVTNEVLPSIRKTGGYGQCVLTPEFQSFIRATVANEVNAALESKTKQKHIKLNPSDNGIPSCFIDFINQSIERDKRYDTKLVFDAFIKLYPTYKYIKQRTFTKWLLISFSPIIRTKSGTKMYFRMIAGVL